jgi:transcription elongation factor GreA
MAGESAHPITAEGHAALEAELRALETEAHRAIGERIRTAREWATSRENAEYHDAKEAQDHLEAKILCLRELRDAAVVVEPASTRRWGSP